LFINFTALLNKD